jgi:hypothetical protein
VKYSNALDLNVINRLGRKRKRVKWICIFQLFEIAGDIFSLYFEVKGEEGDVPTCWVSIFAKEASNYISVGGTKTLAH